MDSLLPKAMRIADLLRARGETVAVAESSSGGLVAAALLSVAGASAYFLGGAVVYTRPARASLLGITADALGERRPSSEPYATLLADTLRERLGASWGIAETGAAGPAGNGYGDAPGHTCLAVSGAATRVTTLETGSDDRVANMHAFAAGLLDLFLAALESRTAI